MGRDRKSSTTKDGAKKHVRHHFPGLRGSPLRYLGAVGAQVRSLARNGKTRRTRLGSSASTQTPLVRCNGQTSRPRRPQTSYGRRLTRTQSEMRIQATPRTATRQLGLGMDVRNLTSVPKPTHAGIDIALELTRDPNNGGTQQHVRASDGAQPSRCSPRRGPEQTRNPPTHT